MLFKPFQEHSRAIEIQEQALEGAIDSHGQAPECMLFMLSLDHPGAIEAQEHALEGAIEPQGQALECILFKMCQGAFRIQKDPRGSLGEPRASS